MSRSIALLLLFCSFGLLAASGQEVIQVTAKDIQQHADHRAFPAYPLKAKTEHVQGTVVFDLRIGTTGKIESMNVVSGPELLRQAAIDCLKQWTFHPFEKDGVPVAAIGQYNIIFVLSDQSNTTIGHGPQSSAPAQSSSPVQVVTVHVKSETAANGPDEELNNKFDTADDACKKGVLAQQYNDATVATCRDAATLADKLPMEDNYIAKRSAYVYAASAYADVGDFKNALPWAAKAVDVIKLGHDGNSGSSAAYEVKGAIEANLGELTPADQDLTVAEDYERKGIIDMKSDSPSVSENFKRILARDLGFHAKVLQTLGRSEEAQKKIDEAAKL